MSTFCFTFPDVSYVIHKEKVNCEPIFSRDGFAVNKFAFKIILPDIFENLGGQRKPRRSMPLFMFMIRFADNFTNYHTISYILEIINVTFSVTNDHFQFS